MCPNYILKYTWAIFQFLISLNCSAPFKITSFPDCESRFVKNNFRVKELHYSHSLKQPKLHLILNPTKKWQTQVMNSWILLLIASMRLVYKHVFSTLQAQVDRTNSFFFENCCISLVGRNWLMLKIKIGRWWSKRHIDSTKMADVCQLATVLRGRRAASYWPVMYSKPF